MAATASSDSGTLPSGSPTRRLAVRPAANAQTMPGRNPKVQVTRTTATRMRLGFTPPTTITGARPAWTIPVTTARSGLR
jgi:hypothetical protein